MSTRIVTYFVCFALIAFGINACSSKNSATDSGADSANTDGSSDSHTQTDGKIDGGNGFKVPSGGGSLNFTTASGNNLTFEFPASAAGKEITISSTTPDVIGWSSAHFVDVIELGPDGTIFSEPVLLTSSKKNFVAFSYAAQGPKSVGEPLTVSADGTALVLTHFSLIAFAELSQLCDQPTSWNKIDNDSYCAGQGSATTSLGFGCTAYQHCTAVEAGCCVEPAKATTSGGGIASCNYGDKKLRLEYFPSDSQGGTYPYCGTSNTDGGATDGGSDSSNTDDETCNNKTPTCNTNNASKCGCSYTTPKFTTSWSLNCDGYQCECRATGAGAGILGTGFTNDTGSVCTDEKAMIAAFNQLCKCN